MEHSNKYGSLGGTQLFAKKTTKVVNSLLSNSYRCLLREEFEKKKLEISFRPCKGDSYTRPKRNPSYSLKNYVVDISQVFVIFLHFQKTLKNTLRYFFKRRANRNNFQKISRATVRGLVFDRVTQIKIWYMVCCICYYNTEYRFIHKNVGFFIKYQQHNMFSVNTVVKDIISLYMFL